MLNRLITLALSGMAVTASAELAFGPLKNYPNIGFACPLLRHAKAEPLPSPEAYPHLFGLDEGLLREDRFSALELWYGLQCCGRWRDAEGNRLVLGRATHLLPDLGDEPVSRERFAAALADDDAAFDPRCRDSLNTWVATFADTTVYAPEERRVNAFALEDVLAYPCAATNTLLYAFRPRRIGNAASADWFCVLLHAPGASDLKTLRDRFEEQFIGAISLPNRLDREDGVRAAELDVARPEQAEPDLPDHPVRAEARKSVENYDAWWVAEADGYVILSDTSTEVGRSLIRDLQETLPALRRAFVQLVPPLTREEEVSLIRLFQSKDDYVRYVGRERAWSSGVWMPARRELVLAQESNRQEMMRIIRHEAFHQYLSHAYCMLAAAPWLNEGHACLFENASVDSKRRVALNEDPARCAFLLENLEAATAHLPLLLRLDYASFYGADEAQRQLHYALAWGLAYYLQKGAPNERNTPFRQILPAFAAALASGERYPEATERAFEGVDMRVFQSNFSEFWLKRRAAAIRFDPLAP